MPLVDAKPQQMGGKNAIVKCKENAIVMLTALAKNKCVKKT
jgi:hypothetical protein